MNEYLEWHLWSAEQVAVSLPALISEVETQLGAFPDEYRDKNQTVLESLRTQMPSLQEIADGVRSRQLVGLGFALDYLGRQAAKEGSMDDSLRLFQAAHELFRGGQPTLKPTRPMRQALGNALEVMVSYEVDRMRAGETDVGLVRDRLQAFVTSAWGNLPPQLGLRINEMLLTELERIRTDSESDRSFHDRFVRDNVEGVLALEIPTRLEKIQDRWQEVGAHIAPAAVRMAERTLRRPEDLSALLPHDVWTSLESAVATADIETLGNALSQVEDALETNLRLRLDAEADYRQPVSELKHRGGPDRFFLKARGLLLRQDPRALDEFRNIHFHRPTHTIAKEWYAYALSQFGQPGDVFEIIELLEDTVASSYFREDLGWTARWNLACALTNLPVRADEALDRLLPALDTDFHPAEVFELCLLWALEQERQDILPSLLLRSPFYEAHLIAALNDAEDLPSSGEAADFWQHFRRINKILRDPDHVFPDPKERLTEQELDQLTRDFIETSLVVAGVEWFRQRLCYTSERNFYKNWECAARLNEEAEDLHAAWRCRARQWECTQRAKRVPEQVKARELQSLLYWAHRHGFEEDGLRILKRGWRSTSMSEGDVLLWDRRLRKIPPDDEEAERPKRSETGGLPDEPKPQELGQVPEDPEVIIQRVAGSFDRVSGPDALATKAEDASQLLAAVARKHRQIPSHSVSAVREVVRLAVAFEEGVDEQQSQNLALEMKEQLEPLREGYGSLPYELQGLARACERVAQNLAVKVKAIPELNITPPVALKVVVARPEPGEACDTRLLARVANPAPEDASDLRIGFSSPSPGIQFLEDEVPLLSLRSQERQVVDVPVRVSDEVEDEISVRIHVTYEIGGVQRTTHAMGRVPVQPAEKPIPFAQRYVISAPVGVDRPDLFHGRDKELSDLQGAFAGGRLLKLYFVNGIRRVGKSSLMQHLGSKCDPDVLPLLLNVETLLGGQRMNSAQLVRQLIRESIVQVRLINGFAELPFEPPDPRAFELDPPWVVFDAFLEELRQRTQRRGILVCLDEVQRLVKRIADPEDPMDDGLLSWLRSQAQAMSNTLVVCTGSEPYDVMRRRYERHTLWGNMEPYNISFVDKAAMTRIVTKPVEKDGVTWLEEATECMWDMTEGHPWVTQYIAERVTERLNLELRRVVGPGDVVRAADEVASDSRVSELWWNEGEDLLTSTHRQIAFLVLQNQTEIRVGIPESQLAEVCQRAGIRTIGKHLDQMRALEVLTEVKVSGKTHWRIRGGFLERYLATLMQRAMRKAGAKISTPLLKQPLALMLDWENIKIGLLKVLRTMSKEEAESLRPRLDGEELGNRLLKAAARHGVPRQKWAVANWDHATFEGDQRALKRAGPYWTDMAGEEKDNASDHVLREKIHWVLREHPEIDAYIIGTGDADFGAVISTLLEQGRHVVLWSTKDSISSIYKHFLTGPDSIQIEWLEDLVFGEPGSG